jgi:hypothetical protein
MITLIPTRWFLFALLCFLPLHISAVVLDDWFILPPKPVGDGPDYEAIGYGLSQGYGWSTYVSSEGWRSVYQNVELPESGLSYSVQLARRGPIVADTNRPPLFPLMIAAVYQVIPRGPWAFGILRIVLACCLSIGCAIAVAWGVALAKDVNSNFGSRGPICVGIASIAIVFSERNLRNYTTDFLTEPVALLMTQAFLLIAWWGSKKGNWQWATFAGATLAGMYFCRGVFVLWVPFLLLWLWYAYRWTLTQAEVRRFTAIGWSTSVLIVFGMLGSILWIRNCYVLGSFQPFGTKGSVTLMGGYCDEAFKSGGEWQFAPEKELRRELEAQLATDPNSAKDCLELELELAKQAKARVKLWVMGNLPLLPQLFASRVITEWNPYQGKALLLKAFAAIGVFWLLRHNRLALLWLGGPLAINSAVVAMTYSVGGRFLVPTYGPFYILAAFGISATLLYATAAAESWRSRVDEP